MKLLALLGYPRTQGHTAHMTDLFLSGAADAGADIQRVDLTTIDLRACRGCFTCWTGTPGRCVQIDAMAPLLDDFLAADAVLIASPVYAFSVTSAVKRFMERTLPLIQPGVELTPDGVEHNLWRHPGRGPRRFAGLLVAGMKSPGLLRPAAETLRLYAGEMRMKCSGILIRAESCALRFPQAKPVRMKAILTAVEKAGGEFVRQERLSDEVLRDVASPLVADLDHFIHYSAVYWEHALAHGGEGEAAGHDAAGDVRILMCEMARSVSPVTTRDVIADIQFVFPDRDWAFRLSVRNGTCSITEGGNGSADLTIRCPTAVWAQVIQRKMTGPQALARPDFHLEGDTSLFRKLPRYFPPSAD